MIREQIQTVVPRRYRYLARKTLFAGMSPLFAGDNVECPVCERSSRRWVSLGFPNKVCPHCSAFERQRLLIMYIRNELPLGREPLTMLHFAAEACFMRHFAATPQLQYIAADLDPPRGAVKMDITAIPLEDDSVDVVICSHVLEHVPDDATAMREIGRILKPGGRALILVPVKQDRAETYEDSSIVDPQERLVHFGQRDHVRLYGTDFEDRLLAAGLKVDANRYARSLGEEATERYGLRADETIFVCT
jgi:SAM-dependent methyltransferase